LQKKEEHKKYEVYLIEFERMIIVVYLEMINRLNLFSKRLNSVYSIGRNFKPNHSIIRRLSKRKEVIESYYKKSNIHTISCDLRDISKPYNNLWSLGFNQLTRVFSNDNQIITELNNLKMIKSEEIEYEISYRYIRFLVGYS